MTGDPDWWDLGPGDSPPLKSILKYPGGKAKLASTILAELGYVDSWTSYVEPFAGGLSLLFAARAAGFRGPAHVGEASPWIRSFWLNIQQFPERVHTAALDVDAASRRDADRVVHYYVTRDAFNVSWDPKDPLEPEQAGILFWILRSGFNGLIRFGPSGINVPAGSVLTDRRPYQIPDLDHVMRVSAALQNVHFYPDAHDAIGAVSDIQGARIYADPPYVGTHAYSSTWDQTCRRHLGDVLSACARAGHRVVVSEVDTTEARQDFLPLDPDPIVIPVRRSISRKADGRILVNECLWRGGPQ